jgi:hypothetical protein
MSRLLLAVAIAAILLLVGAFVPVYGKTLIERWNAAPSASAFADRTFAEISQGWDRLWGDKPAARPAGKQAPAKGGPASKTARSPSGGGAPPAAGTGPAEHHTEADRSAIDRIVAEHASDRPAPRR